MKKEYHNEMIFNSSRLDTLVTFTKENKNLTLTFGNPEWGVALNLNEMDMLKFKNLLTIWKMSKKCSVQVNEAFLVYTEPDLFQLMFRNATINITIFDVFMFLDIIDLLEKEENYLPEPNLQNYYEAPVTQIPNVGPNEPNCPTDAPKLENAQEPVGKPEGIEIPSVIVNYSEPPIAGSEQMEQLLTPQSSQTMPQIPMVGNGN